MFTFVITLGLVVICLQIVVSHEQPGGFHLSKEECGKKAQARPFLSYHIHALFWQTNNASVEAAMSLRAEFSKAFDVTEDCTFSAGQVEPQQRSMCFFGVDMEPAGPFLTAQWSVFIPRHYYEESVSWTLARRGNLDIFIHPVTGCSTEDHVDFPVWGGMKWELDASIFNS
jgi:aromatic ring-cleaving dioxygenase